MVEKASSFSSFLARTPMIVVNRLKGSDNYQSWANSVTLWFTGNGVEDHLTSMESSVDADKQGSGGNMMLYSIIFSNSPSSLKHSITMEIIRPVSLFGPKLRIYI